MTSPRKGLQSTIRLKSDSVLKTIKNIYDCASPQVKNYSDITVAESKDLNVELSRENTRFSEPQFISLKESIEGNATQYIRGRIKKDQISTLKPISDKHELGAMHVASEKLKKSVTTDKLKLTNSLKTQM